MNHLSMQLLPTTPWKTVGAKVPRLQGPKAWNREQFGNELFPKNIQNMMNLEPQGQPFINGWKSIGWLFHFT